MPQYAILLPWLPDDPRSDGRVVCFHDRYWLGVIGPKIPEGVVGSGEADLFVEPRPQLFWTPPPHGWERDARDRTRWWLDPAEQVALRRAHADLRRRGEPTDGTNTSRKRRHRMIPLPVTVVCPRCLNVQVIHRDQSPRERPVRSG